MDAKQDQHPPMQGDDELAKALQGGLQFEETPVPGDQAGTAPAVDPTNAPDPLTMVPAPVDEPPTIGTALPQPDDDNDTPSLPPEIKHSHVKADDGSKNKDDRPVPATNATSAGSGPLDKLKASALEELRPLVGKLELPAEEKFDTLLLIIRSTDDQSLLDEAHDAAKGITDDTKRAQALLDIIKEIDYFSSRR
jgi:hypothetical protein